MTKIMVVDDEPDPREMIELIMQKEGFETEMAVDGSDFLEKVDSFNPDIVILDVMMPGPTTWEIVGRMKGKKSNPKIILVTVVRFTEEEKKSLCEAANVVGYIKKPFDHDDIMDVAKKSVSRT